MRKTTLLTFQTWSVSNIMNISLRSVMISSLRSHFGSSCKINSVFALSQSISTGSNRTKSSSFSSPFLSFVLLTHLTLLKSLGGGLKGILVKKFLRILLHHWTYYLYRVRSQNAANLPQRTCCFMTAWELTSA